MDNVVVAPHCLCVTEEYLRLAWSGRLRHADQISRGEIPAEVVNKDVLEKADFKKKFADYTSA